MGTVVEKITLLQILNSVLRVYAYYCQSTSDLYSNSFIHNRHCIDTEYRVQVPGKPPLGVCQHENILKLDFKTTESLGLFLRVQHCLHPK
jgi:hypothetical protein